ncbi:MAG: hypothetical protein ACT4PO_04080 [Actinomycetota bacterium]
MSDLGDALELMHTAVRRWRTLRAAGFEWRHQARSRLAWDRWTGSMERRGSGRTSTVAFGRSNDESEPEPEETEEPWRFWLAPPDRIRAEFAVGDEPVSVVIAGDTWWSWSPSQGASTNAGRSNHEHGTGPGHALTDPSTILPAVELQVTGRSAFLGRGVLHVLATPSEIDDNDEESGDWRGATHGFGNGADEYDLLVDARRGVLLRSEARIGGEPFRVLEMREVAFDESFPEGTFDPPEGVEFEPPHVSRAVVPADLQTAVSFTVLVPERPFAPLEARVEAPIPRYGIPEQVHISFASRWFGEDDRQFWLIESAEPIPERPGLAWEQEAEIRLGEDRESQPPLRIARLERLGTHVEIQSHHVGRDELLELARSLVPLPEEPPPLVSGQAGPAVDTRPT